MKKIYFVKTAGYNMLVSVDEKRECRYLTENKYFPSTTGEEENDKEIAMKFINEDVADDSGWEDDCTYAQLFEDFPIEILAEIEKDI